MVITTSFFFFVASLFAQGDKLVSKSTFPESANNNEMARHLYYLGRIKATQLEYSAAHQHLLQVCQNYILANCLCSQYNTHLLSSLCPLPSTVSSTLLCLSVSLSSPLIAHLPPFFEHTIQAIRKAPQHSAVGFKQTAHKFVVVVQLLLGEIPDRATFRDPILRKSLLPYFQLTQGDH